MFDYGLVFFSFWGSFVIFQMSLDLWVGCEEYDECEWDLELNSRQALFECWHGRYWYLDDRVLPQVQHVYPLTTIPIPPCPSIQLANLLTNEEIARARVGLVVLGVPGTYSEFIRTHLQGWLAGISVSLFPSEVKVSSCIFLFHISAW